VRSDMVAPKNGEHSVMQKACPHKPKRRRAERQRGQNRSNPAI
jgi:hypothetical protein